MGNRLVLKAHQRFSDYDKEHSWQYEIRIQNKAEALRLANLSEEDVKALSIGRKIFNSSLVIPII